MRQPAALIGLVILAAVGAGVTALVHRVESTAVEARFAAEAEQQISDVRVRLGQYVALLDGARAHVVAEGELRDPAGYATFVENLRIRQDYAGLQGIGVAEAVPPGADPILNARLAGFHGPGLTVWPESRQDLRTAIVALEPLDARNRAALGFDMYSEESRRTAMRRARLEGVASISAPVVLKQEITSDQQPGVLIYLPLLMHGAFRGYVYAPLRAGDFMEAALSTSRSTTSLRLDDVTDGEAQLLFTSPDMAAPTLRHVTEVPVAGRLWRFTVVPKVAPSVIGFFAPVTGFAFLLLSLTAAAAVSSDRRARERDRALAVALQRASDDKDLMLREMSHRMKNALARVTAIARQSVRSASSKEELAETLTARLRAMAKAQDLITRDGGDSIDIRRLLQAELDQLDGGSGERTRLKGPVVPLNPGQTQALGLIFHELATNSLKYGAGASGSPVEVSWRVEEEAGELRVVLVWDEQIPGGARAPERKGFGSQLLENLAEGELEGTYERRFHEGGLTVTLSFPQRE